MFEVVSLNKKNFLIKEELFIFFYYESNKLIIIDNIRIIKILKILFYSELYHVQNFALSFILSLISHIYLFVYCNGTDIMIFLSQNKLHGKRRYTMSGQAKVYEKSAL